MRKVELAVQILGAALVIWFFHWTVESSGGFNPPGDEDYYNFLVRGWRAGHLHMEKPPHEGMARLADPYDPVQNRDYRLADATYFNGRYYLYFSAVPALLTQFPYALITGKELGTTTGIFIFLSVGLVASMLLWIAMVRRFFPDGSPLWSLAGILVIGFGNNLLVLARRPLVWEFPIAAAYAFASITLLLVHRSLVSTKPVRWLMAAGFTAGAMVACRPGSVFATLLFLPVILFHARRGFEGRRLWRPVAALAAPMALWVVAILIHNHERFGKFLEFGISYQLSSVYEGRQRHFSPDYLAHNLRIYLSNPLGYTSEFPFVTAVAVRGGPAGYLDAWVEPIAGMLPTFPHVVAGLACLLVTGFLRRHSPEFRTLVQAMGIAGIGALGFLLLFYCATPRYTAEFLPHLSFLACLAALACASAFREKPGAGWWRALFLVLVLVGVIHGALLSLDYHQRLLQRLRPEYWTHIADGFSWVTRILQK